MWPLNDKTTAQLYMLTIDRQSKYLLVTTEPFASCVPDGVSLCWHNVE
jgi:hypothetical protein